MNESIEKQIQEQGIPFGKYRLVSKLAVGGMAELFLARQVGLAGFNKTVAIKCILPHFSQKKDFVTMFLDEARVASHLNHPNVVQIYDIGEYDGIYFMSMEYIAGQNLKAFHKRLHEKPEYKKTAPYSLLAAIFAQAAAGLDHVHTAHDTQGNPLHIVHRDISPNNLLLSYEGVLKIVDFGVAKARSQEHETEVGTLKGRLSYMSPEHLSGHDVDGRSDLFALGVVLYELTTHRRLFRRRSEAETIQAILQSPIPPPSRFGEGYPPRLEEILLKVLQRDPALRYQSSAEFREALEQFSESEGVRVGSRQIAEMMAYLFAPEKEKEKQGKLGTPVDQNDMMNLSRGSYRVMNPHSASFYGSFASASYLQPNVDPVAAAAAQAQLLALAAQGHLSPQLAQALLTAPVLPPTGYGASPPRPSVDPAEDEATTVLSSSDQLPAAMVEGDAGFSTSSYATFSAHADEPPPVAFDDAPPPAPAKQPSPPPPSSPSPRRATADLPASMSGGGVITPDTESPPVLSYPPPAADVSEASPALEAGPRPTSLGRRLLLPLMLLLLALVGGGVAYLLRSPASSPPEPRPFSGADLRAKVDASLQDRRYTEAATYLDQIQQINPRASEDPWFQEAQKRREIGLRIEQIQQLLLQSRKQEAADSFQSLTQAHTADAIERLFSEDWKKLQESFPSPSVVLIPPPQPPPSRPPSEVPQSSTSPTEARGSSPEIRPTPRPRPRPRPSVSASRLSEGHVALAFTATTFSKEKVKILPSEHLALCKKIEAEAARLLKHPTIARGITRPWQRTVAEKLKKSRAYVFYPRAALYVIYTRLKQGKSPSDVAKTLAKYQERRTFSKYRDK